MPEEEQIKGVLADSSIPAIHATYDDRILLVTPGSYAYSIAMEIWPRQRVFTKRIPPYVPIYSNISVHAGKGYVSIDLPSYFSEAKTKAEAMHKFLELSTFYLLPGGVSNDREQLAQFNGTAVNDFRSRRVFSPHSLSAHMIMLTHARGSGYGRYRVEDELHPTKFLFTEGSASEVVIDAFGRVSLSNLPTAFSSSYFKFTSYNDFHFQYDNFILDELYLIPPYTTIHEGLDDIVNDEVRDNPKYTKIYEKDLGYLGLRLGNGEDAEREEWVDVERFNGVE